MSEESDDRSYAATLARRFYEGTVTKEAFIGAFAESEDELIQEIVTLIYHEPKRKGFVSDVEMRYQIYFQYAQAVIAELDKGETGAVPVHLRPKPNASGKAIAGWSLFALFAGASAAEQIGKLWRHFQGTKILEPWQGVLSVGGLGIGSFATAVAIRLVWSLVRYRRESRRNGAG